MTTKEEPIELVHGSGNVFRDFGVPDAEVHHVKALLAAQIIQLLDDQRISLRRAEALSGFTATDFSRIRDADLSRFTIDRLMRFLATLGSSLDQPVDFRFELRVRRGARQPTRERASRV